MKSCLWDFDSPSRHSFSKCLCVAALFCPTAFAGDWLMGDRRVMGAAIMVMGIDVVFVLAGHSGYVALLVMTVPLVTMLARGSWRIKAVTGGAVTHGCPRSRLKCPGWVTC